MAKTMSLDKISQNFKEKDIITLDQFSSEDLIVLFKHTKKLKNLIEGGNTPQLLKGNLVTLLFFEPSTRTFSSFASAIKRLGGETLEFQDPLKVSSIVKGESLSDMIKALSVYCDALVIRHPVKGSVTVLTDASEKPVINAGDGVGEHPTQALLDLFTIQEKVGRLDNLTCLMAGDMLNGRTVHSLIKGLSKFKNNKIFLMSPKSLRLAREDFNYFQKKDIKVLEIFDEEEIPKNANFWYWTRVQKERFKSQKEYNRVKNKFILNKRIIDKFASPKTFFFHPLPRVGEILEEVDEDKRALYLSDQIKNGLFVRMALLSLILGKIK